MMSETPETERARPQITPGQIARWSLPLVVSLAILVLAFVMNWQPWFGYASVIAGALGTLMYVGHSYGVGES